MPNLKERLERVFGRASASDALSKNALTPEQRQDLMGSSGLSSTATSFRAAWQLIKPYWTSEQKKKACLMLAGVTALSLGQVGMNIAFNDWYGSFNNAVTEKNFDVFKTQLLVFTGLASAWMAISVGRAYLTRILHINWRDWMTQKMMDKYMDNKTFYRLQSIYQNTDNPQNRLAKDINHITGSSLNLSMGLLRSSISLPFFINMLWNMSGTTTIPVGDTMVAVPGLMVWIALTYAGVGTWLTHKIGHRLIDSNYQQEKKEADFEYALTRVRENAEAIALYEGEKSEKISLKGNFSKVIGNSFVLARQQKNLDTFNFGYNQAAVISLTS